jgi:hypothetical protein
MAVPSFIEESGYTSIAACTDVASIETAFWAKAQTLSAPWTNPSSGVYKTPVDAAGRWMDITFARQTATNMDVKIRNESAATVDQGRFQIVSGYPVYIFMGAHYYHIVAMTAAAGHEWSRGGMIDEAPESQTSHAYYHYAHNFRTTGDASRNAAITDLFKWTGAAYASATALWGFNMTRGLQTTLTLISPYTGSYLWFPVMMSVTNVNGGRLYNHYWGSSIIPPTTLVTIPMDAGVNGTFFALPNASTTAHRLFIRKS